MTINETQRCLTIRRGAVLVAGNLGTVPATIDIVGRHRLLLASDCGVRCRNGAVHLPAESIAVLEGMKEEMA